MKKSTLTAVIGTALITAALGSTGTASATAPAPTSAAATIRALEAHEYRVILNKVGTEPLSRCSVTSIRPEPPLTETVPIGGGDTMQKVVYTPAYVDVGC